MLANVELLPVVDEMAKFFMATPKTATGSSGLLRIHTFDNAGTDYRRDDLFSEKRTSTVHERLPFNLARGETVSFGILRQSLFLAPLLDFCAVNNIYLTVRVRGKASFTVFAATPGGEVPRLVTDRIVSGSGQEEDIFICRLSDLPTNSRLFWSVACVSETLQIDEVSFTTDSAPVNSGALVVLIRTFGRTSDVANLLNQIHQGAVHAHHREMLASTKFIFVDTSGGDAKREFDRLYKGSLNLFSFKAKNLGGGGNASQLLEIVDEAVGASALEVSDVLMLDDDVEISTESLYRYWAFTRLRKIDAICTLPIFMKSRPTTVWEDGGIWGRFTEKKPAPERVDPFPYLIKHGLRLQGFENLARFEPLNLPEYATFIFFGIPWRVLKKIGYPAAFFLRGDDIEYSLRCGRNDIPLVSNQNLVAWHEPTHSYAQEYMAILHGLIINLEYGTLSKKHLMNFFLDRFDAHSRQRDYRAILVYSWVLEALVGCREIMDDGFEEHYYAVIKRTKALDIGFTTLPIRAEGRLKEAGEREGRTVDVTFLYPAAEKIDIARHVIMRNQNTGKAAIYDARDTQAMTQFAVASTAFFASLGKLEAEWEGIVAHWRARLAATSSKDFWSAQRAKFANELQTLCSDTWKAPAVVEEATASRPTAADAAPAVETSSAVKVSRRMVKAGPVDKARRPASSRLTGLPDGFDEDVYLAINQDVMVSKMSAADHYLKFGRAEGRKWR